MIAQLRRFLTASVMVIACSSFSAVSVSGCGDDDGESDGHSEQELTGDCKVITEACHDIDDGEGEAANCHEIAHDNDTDACTAAKEACLEVCEEHGHED